jgi:hypothetical protein
LGHNYKYRTITRTKKDLNYFAGFYTKNKNPLNKIVNTAYFNLNQHCPTPADAEALVVAAVYQKLLKNLISDE